MKMRTYDVHNIIATSNNYFASKLVSVVIYMYMYHFTSTILLYPTGAHGHLYTICHNGVMLVSFQGIHMMLT